MIDDHQPLPADPPGATAMTDLDGRTQEAAASAAPATLSQHLHGLGSIKPAPTPSPGTLLDFPIAHSLLERVRDYTSRGLYTYQLPLTESAAAHAQILGHDVVQFSTYGYLGLNGHPEIVAAAQQATETFGTSAGGVRLLTGTMDIHLQLERDLADFLGVDKATSYSSGYQANLAAISSVLGLRDAAILDELAHRSLVDGARLAGCMRRTFRHNDARSLAQHIERARNDGAERVLVIVDGVYSMDGDMAPLAELLDVTKNSQAFLLVDESHAIGALGLTGRGTCEVQGINPNQIDILTGSLGKAIPSTGGFVAGSHGLQLLMQHASPAYIFSGALSPANAGAVRQTIAILNRNDGRLNNLARNTAILRDGLAALGLRIGGSPHSPVVPLYPGSEITTLTWARQLLDFGVMTSTVVPPAVAAGSERIRLCACATHTPDDFDRLFAGLRHCITSGI
jgi:8-amino-7-oxononanoate synthase